MQHDWSWHYLERIAVATERTAKAQSATRRDVAQLLTLAKRAVIVAALYGGGITLLMLGEEKARIAVELIRALR